VADFYANRAWAHHLRGEFAEALRDADKSLELDPNCAFAVEGRARALKALGR